MFLANLQEHNTVVIVDLVGTFYVCFMVFNNLLLAKRFFLKKLKILQYLLAYTLSARTAYGPDPISEM